MTFDEYIKNPMGNKSSVMTNRQLYKNLYTEKWDAIKVRENGKIDFRMYNTKDKEYFLHIKIPSEVVPKFYYDTIIRFYIDGNSSISMENTLNHYDVQFYSNDPNFVFTFAHAFNKHDMFIKDLSSKIGSIALKQAPAEKNPNDDTGYVKSLYFAYLEIQNLKLMNKSIWKIKSQPYNKNIWSDIVEHADDKIHERQIQGAAIEKHNRAVKRTQQVVNAVNNASNHKFLSPLIKDFGKFKGNIVNKVNTKFVNPLIKKK